MWADSFLRFEQQHVFLLLLWAGSTVLSGTSIAIVLAAQHRESPLLAHFAMQLAGWGVLAGILAGVEWHGIHLRDVAGATRVERLAWLRIGFDLGIMGMGVILAAAGRVMARSPRMVGAGMAVVINGLALFAIDVQFVGNVSR